MSGDQRPGADYAFHEEFVVNNSVKENFDQYGYIILRGLLNEVEVGALRDAIETDPAISASRYTRDDGQGGRTALVLWNEADDSLTGRLARSHKVAGTVQQLLGGEVYPYHIKLSLKEAHSGGAWVWHQDYGYWYENGCMFPNMASVFIAVDKATKENGCLKMLVGSHRAGRVDHVVEGGQVGADSLRVSLLQDALPLLEVEMEAGDAIFFHCNLMHRSDQNRSIHRRYGYIAAFNRADNDPVYKDISPGAHYTKMTQVPNSSILNASRTLQTRDFFLNNKSSNALSKIREKLTP